MFDIAHQLVELRVKPIVLHIPALLVVKS
jgi:hypothetical protein